MIFRSATARRRQQDAERARLETNRGIWQAAVDKWTAELEQAQQIHAEEGVLSEEQFGRVILEHRARNGDMSIFIDTTNRAAEMTPTEHAWVAQKRQTELASAEVEHISRLLDTSRRGLAAIEAQLAALDEVNAA